MPDSGHARPSDGMEMMSWKHLETTCRSAMKAFLVGLVVVLLAVMCLQIVMRYSFNASLIWAEEVCRYLLVWCSLLACVFAYERGEIAAVTLLRDAVGPRAGLVLQILCNLAAAILCAVVAWYGHRYALLAGSQPVPALRFLFEDTFGWSPSTVPTVYWVYLALPIGISLLGLRLLIDVAHYIALIRAGGTAQDLRKHDVERFAE